MKFVGGSQEKPKICRTILDAVGATPAVFLNKVYGSHDGIDVIAKLEFLNPSGSIKDRMVKFILSEERNRSGKYPKIMVESSSGNTGAALAMACAVNDARCEIAVPDSTSEEKMERLRAYGANVHVCERFHGPDNMDYYAVGERIAQENAALYLDQYKSPLNLLAHYSSTAPELWDQLDGALDYFVCGIGSGGTISGVGRFLKERCPAVKVIGVEPTGSVFQSLLTQQRGSDFMGSSIEGIGKKSIPVSLDPSVIDEVVQVDDETAIEFTRKLAQREGILAGGSSGSVAAAIDHLIKSGVRGRIVTIFPDSGMFYLSKYFQDAV